MPVSRGGYAFVLFLFCGCAANVVRYRAPDFPGGVPGTIAVLPFDNETMSFAAPSILRAMVAERLGGFGYRIVPEEDVDQKLHAMGVTDGGQLGAFSPGEIGEKVGAPGLMYGSVEEFVYQNVGFFRKREVRLRLKFVHAERGERLWEDVGAEARIHVALNKKEAGRSFLEGVIEQAAEKLLNIPLEQESRLAVEQVLSKYPRRGY